MGPHNHAVAAVQRVHVADTCHRSHLRRRKKGCAHSSCGWQRCFSTSNREAPVLKQSRRGRHQGRGWWRLKER